MLHAKKKRGVCGYKSVRNGEVAEHALRPLSAHAGSPERDGSWINMIRSAADEIYELAC